MANFGAAVAVSDPSGNIQRTIPLKKIPHLVAGDNVTCEGAENECRIIKLHPRSTVLERPDRRGKLKAVAANLTQLVIVAAVRPEIDPLLLDQFCVVAERARIRAVVVLNKADLAEEDELKTLSSVLEIYAQIGYPTAVINTRSAAAMAPLEHLLNNNTSVLVGQSGVGKSSIVQCLLPDLDVRVGAISAATGIGSHTTTVSFRYVLPGVDATDNESTGAKENTDNGVLIDSPGVRQFSVDHLQSDQVASGYREIFDAAADCRFANCTHQVEPGCAVKRGVEDSSIADWRYANYLKLIAVEN